MSTTTLNDVTYTTADKVAVLLGITAFSATTATATTAISGRQAIPNQGEVEDFILWAEDEINQRTGHSWKAVTITDEYYDITSEHIHHHHGHHREIALYVNHRDLNTFVSGTHKIEFWNGTVWKDLILTSNGFTNDRGADYWIDELHGVIYFVNQRPVFRRNGVRLTYAYGASTVPKDIERAATLLAGIQLLSSDDYSPVFPEGGDRISLQSKAEVWRQEVDRLLSRRDELILI